MADKAPRDEWAAWGGLVAVCGFVSRRLEAALQERHRISHAEFEVLVLLAAAPQRRLRLSDLSAKSALTLSGMSRLVDRLGRSGLVARVACREDHRGAFAQLTDDGMARLRAAEETVSHLVHERFLGLYDDEEVAALVGYWRRYFATREDDVASGGAEGPNLRRGCAPQGHVA